MTDDTIYELKVKNYALVSLLIHIRERIVVDDIKEYPHSYFMDLGDDIDRVIAKNEVPTEPPS